MQAQAGPVRRQTVLIAAPRQTVGTLPADPIGGEWAGAGRPMPVGGTTSFNITAPGQAVGTQLVGPVKGEHARAAAHCTHYCLGDQMARCQQALLGKSRFMPNPPELRVP